MSAIELGDLERGYREINISCQDPALYSLSCPLMLGIIIAAIPKYTKGKLALTAKNRQGEPLASRVDALELPSDTESPYMLAPPGKVDARSLATAGGNGAPREIKEWQAIMDHLRQLPVKRPGELPTIPVDARAAEVRAIRAA